MVQGGSIPVIIEFDENVDSITEFHASLFDSDGEALKEWETDDVEFDGKTVKCPVTESETLSFPVGRCTLEIKYEIDGVVIPAEVVKMRIEKRYDTHTIGGGTDESN